ARLSKTQYQYTLTDVDQNELNKWASKLLNVLQTSPELSDVATDQATTGRQLNLEINRDTAARLGIDPAAIDNTLYDAFGQRRVGQIFTTLNFYWVLMEVEPQFQLGPYALNRIYVGSSSGAQVPLSQFVTMVPSVAPLAVNHQGQFPSVTLSFNLSPGSSVGSAAAAIQKAAQALH